MVFGSIRAIAFYVSAKRDLGVSLYDLSHGESMVLGEVIDTDWSANDASYNRKLCIGGMK
jgi:hypothetical protein